MGMTKMPSVVFAHEQDLPWLPLRETPGFDGMDIPGVECKFLVSRMWDRGSTSSSTNPTSRSPDTHKGDVFHYILEGEWKMGSRVLPPGFMQFEQKGLYYGPFTSGPEGSMFLAIYDHEPAFVEPDDKR